MRRQRRVAMLAVLAALATGACSQQSRPRPTDAPVPALSIPADFAGVILVARGPRTLLFHGYGEVGGAPLQPDSRFWVASIGKQFAAAAILKLTERGRISLDDPLVRFFANAPSDKAAITIRQLLSHTSGLGQSYVSEQQSSRESAVARMFAEPLKGRPGGEFGYSNSNIQLAAAIVEVASGMSYPEFVKRELWRPAGLRATGFAGSAGAARVAPVRGALPNRLQRTYWGEQGVYSTAGDLLRWYRALISGRILNPASVETMFSPIQKIGEGHATLGWFRGRTGSGSEYIFVRGNEDFGANGLLYAYPASNTVIIVLTHAGNADDETSWSRAVLRSLEQQLAL